MLLTFEEVYKRTDLGGHFQRKCFWRQGLFRPAFGFLVLAVENLVTIGNYSMPNLFMAFSRMFSGAMFTPGCEPDI